MSEPSSTALRALFPALRRTVAGRPVVYLDTAASALKPEEVIEAEIDYYRTNGANVHRGQHAFASEATEAFEAARHEVAAFLGARSDDEIVFVASSTDALNLVVDGLALSGEDEVLVARTEHHSALLPVLRRCAVRLLEASLTEPLSPDAVRAAIGPRTRALVLGHASNVSGLIQPVRELCGAARAAGLHTIVDGAQSTPHLPVDVVELGCDFFTFSAHKVYGPTGVGVLWGRREALEALAATRLGGGTVERVTPSGYSLRALPHRLEAGTPNIAGALGLAAALRLLRRVGRRHVEAHSRRIGARLGATLRAIPGIEVIAAEGAVPVASFALPDAPVRAGELATMLSDQHGVLVRAGYHCAHLAFPSDAPPGGVLRASAGVYTSDEDIERLGEAVRDVASLFGVRP